MFNKVLRYYSFRIYILFLGVILVVAASLLPFVYPPLCYVRSPVGNEEFVGMRIWTTPCVTDLGYKELIDRPYLYATLTYLLGAALVAVSWLFMIAKIALDFRQRKQIQNYGINASSFLIITLLLLSSIVGSIGFGIFSPPGLGGLLR